MKIANIVYEKELVNHTKVDYVNYYNEPIEYEKLDMSLPTLYVGWSFMKNCNPDNQIIQNADILKRKIITNELYWECSFEEGKASHVKGINSFVNDAPSLYYIPKYMFTNLDPVFFQIKDLEDFLDIIPKNIKATYHYKNEMVYLLFENKNFGENKETIVSINLKMYEFFQFNVEKMVEYLKQRTEYSYFDNEGDEYLKYYKIFPNFILLKRYLVSILSK